MTLPFFPYAIAWYGLLFALGVIGGYLVLAFLLFRWFSISPLVEEEDVVDVADFVSSRGSIGQEVWSLFSPSLQRRLIQNSSLSKREKRELVGTINQWILQGEASFSEKRALQRRYLLEKAWKKGLLSIKKKSRFFSERLANYVLLGILIGARLGHLVFYEHWSSYLMHPLTVFKVREGGLASHGGVIGVLIALFLFCRKYQPRYKWISWKKLLDFLALPALLLAVFIRVGNFINQEIVGVETRLPWGVIFGNPLDGGEMIPRHPTQLYEALFYLVLFIGWMVPALFFPRWLFSRHAGFLGGMVCTLVFLGRIIFENFKCHQSYWTLSSPITMGQILSIPFLVVGIALLKNGKWKDLLTKKRSKVDRY